MNQQEMLELRDKGSKLIREISKLADSLAPRYGPALRYRLGQLENLFDQAVDAVNEHTHET